MMSARDTSMSLEEFRQYWSQHRRLIVSAKAYDPAGRRWVEGEEIFRAGGAYTLIVVQFRSRDFLRISVKPSLKVAYAPGRIASPGTWGSAGVHLTFEEKEFLQGMGDREMSLDELIGAVESSGFPGKETLAGKLRRAAAALER
jgi:hypothetical protein